MEEKVVTQTLEGGVALLILNRPERRNAIDGEMTERLPIVLEKLEQGPEVKVVVFTGRGDHFCSGGDLSAGETSTDYTLEEHRDITRKCAKAVRTLLRMEKPVIGMVRGYALGGGASLVLACDVIYASDDAKFASQFLRIGLVPEWGASYLLPMAVGLNRAKEIFFSAGLVDAREAYRIGLVNQVFPKERLEEATLAFARNVASLPSAALRMTKRQLNSLFLNNLESVFEWEAQAIPFCGQTREFKENIAAFQKKARRSFVKKEE